MTDVLSSFEDLQDEFYPHSTQKRRESREARQARMAEQRAAAKAGAEWDAKPIVIKWTAPTGEFREDEFFTTGMLARALNRDSVTIRAWMRKGWLPRNQYQTKPVYGTRGNAPRRLWTRSQVEGIIRIAAEEGILEPGKLENMSATKFPQKIFSVWKSL